MIAASASVGYLGFLVGPPVVGALSGVVGLRAALALVVVAGVAISFADGGDRVTGKQQSLSLSASSPEVTAEFSSGVDLSTTVSVLDGCPMFASAYMGGKRISSNAFTPLATILAFGRSLLPAKQERWKGLRPSFSAHVR